MYYRQRWPYLNMSNVYDCIDKMTSSSLQIRVIRYTKVTKKNNRSNSVISARYYIRRTWSELWMESLASNEQGWVTYWLEPGAQSSSTPSTSNGHDSRSMTTLERLIWDGRCVIFLEAAGAPCIPSHTNIWDVPASYLRSVRSGSDW